MFWGREYQRYSRVAGERTDWCSKVLGSATYESNQINLQDVSNDKNSL